MDQGSGVLRVLEVRGCSVPRFEGSVARRFAACGSKLSGLATIADTLDFRRLQQLRAYVGPQGAWLRTGRGPERYFLGFSPICRRHVRCSTSIVAGVKRFEDLIAYQRTVELRDLLYDMTAGPRLSTDSRFRDQVRDSASSAPRNIAEGFSRYSPRGVHAVHDHRPRINRRDAESPETRIAAGILHAADYDSAWTISCRAMAAVGGLGRYLRSCKGSRVR